MQLTEQEKIDRDLLLYGESFEIDGKHVPVEDVVVHIRKTCSIGPSIIPDAKGPFKPRGDANQFSKES